MPVVRLRLGKARARVLSRLVILWSIYKILA
jgi:hypothetical protein